MAIIRHSPPDVFPSYANYARAGMLEPGWLVEVEATAAALHVYGSGRS